MIRMNLFQQLTRCWDQIHPYNAAQVMRLTLSCSAHDAQTAWNATLRHLALGHVEVAHQHYRHCPGHSTLIQLPPGIDPETFVAEELNTPFATAASPFRPFIQCDQQGMLAGIIYHHWAADSVSIRLLMREWFFRLTGEGQPRVTPVPMLSDNMAQPAEPLSAALRGTLRLMCSLKSVRRLPVSMSTDLQVGHRVLNLPKGTGQSLHRAAHAHGVKVTDLLLCTIAELCHRYLPPAPKHRPNLALGTIRDARPNTFIADPDAVGAALAFSSIICPANTLTDRAALLQKIAHQTAEFRNRRNTRSRDLDLRLALFTVNLVGQRRAMEFFRKRMPFSAGLSNVDLSRTWVTDYPHLLTDFYRVSPAGPALPLVITPTTVGERFNISLTWRKRVLTPAAIDALANDLQSSLAAWLPATPASTPTPLPPLAAHAPAA